MDVNVPRDDQGSELDLEGYPAEPGRSLVEVAAAGVADRLSRVGKLTRADLPLPLLVATGTAVGACLGGLLLISS